MGLDITAYEGVEFIAPYSADKVDELYTQGGFPLCRIGSHASRADSLEDGVYKLKDKWCEVYEFRAGSYSGYNSWRRMLCEAVYHMSDLSFWEATHKGDVTSGAFLELIDFSDCEGVIGPETSKKLARDFEMNLKDIMAWALDTITNQEELAWFMVKYMDWWKAFRVASNKGAVSFH